ncbi:MAG: hypothetical protein IKR03_00290, partial [Clostridia bacterium]|nr:hypothetical protein [Clostridia bacterium]
GCFFTAPFCTLHSSFFVLLSSLRSSPRLFPVKREKRKEKRIGSFAPQSISFVEEWLSKLSIPVIKIDGTHSIEDNVDSVISLL